VATAVGATVLTDTASLVVLAAVSGSQLAGGGPASIGLQIVVGLAVVAVFTLVVLPRLIRVGFRYLGTDRVVRYLLAVAAFLSAATVAEVFGIEPIVGAFFAGLGLNRLIPNEGPLMERIDFFGSAVFIPVFLVSVGMLLKPSVMVQPETLKLAGLFILASVGGKTLACVICKRPMHLTWAEATLMLGLTMPQAAATLAATVIGFNIGLFDQSVVNAVLVLILVTIVAATLLVQRTKTTVTVDRAGDEVLGKRILVALEDPAQARLGFIIGARIAAPDSGVVRGLLRSTPGDTAVQENNLSQLRTAGYAVGVDVDPALLVHTALEEGIINTVAAHHPSFVLVGQRRSSAHPVLGGAGEAVAASISAPVAILVGEASRLSEVILIETESGPDSPPNGASALAVELATRIGGKTVIRHPASSALRRAEVASGQLWIAPADTWPVLAATDPPSGGALMVVFHSAVTSAQ
jgi:Sodium/hydrogen exchanger family